MADKKVPAEALLPKVADVPEQDEGEMYWIGALQSCPVNCVNIGGVSFPVTVERVYLDERSNQTVREPGMGVIRRLNKQELARLEERIPRCIVRWRGGSREPLNTIPGDPHNDEAQVFPSRQGFLLTIPTEEDRAKMVEAGRYRPVIVGPDDDPIARHLYMKKQHYRETEEPQPLSVTGIPL